MAIALAKKLQRDVKLARFITHANVTPINSTDTSCFLRRAANTIKDHSQPSHSFFSPFPSVWRDKSLKAHISQFKNTSSFLLPDSWADLSYAEDECPNLPINHIALFLICTFSAFVTQNPAACFCFLLHSVMYLCLVWFSWIARKTKFYTGSHRTWL